MTACLPLTAGAFCTASYSWCTSAPVPSPLISINRRGQLTTALTTCRRRRQETGRGRCHRTNCTCRRRRQSVADEAFVAHEEVGEVAVMGDLRWHFVGGVMHAVDVGDGRLVDQVVDQVFVGGDGVEHARMPQRFDPVGG